VSDPRSQWLEDLRPVVFAIAYRMLGSVAEAEDVVQETLLRVHRVLAGGEEVESLRAYAATIATRLAIDVLRSARVRRETYVGDWLPEPIVTDAADDPARAAEMADSLSLAFLVLLEALSPEQRAALLLRDVFDYGYAEIAEIVGTSEANAPGAGQRPAGCAAVRRRRRPDQRHGTHHRRRADPGRELDRQPGQDRARRGGRRPAGAAGAAGAVTRRGGRRPRLPPTFENGVATGR